MPRATSPTPNRTGRAAPGLEARSSWEIEPGQAIISGTIARARLGGGARYEVYLAFNERLGHPTVLKLLRPALVADPRARRAMAREADVLAAIHDHAIVSAVEIDLDGDRPFLGLEYVEGHRLSTVLRRNGPMAVDRVVSIGRCLAATLDRLHAAGIVHLDVKPSNVILASVPTLIDLSVARRTDRAHRINGFVGTDAHMAPEQADPALWATIGPKADAWGLGVTLYRALTGRLPWPRGRRDASGDDRFPQLVATPAPLDSARDEARLVEIIMAALTPSSDARPSVAELHTRLAELHRRGTARFDPGYRHQRGPTVAAGPFRDR